MFNRTTKQMVINMNQVELFENIMMLAIGEGNKYRFGVKFTKLGSQQEDGEIGVFKFIGINNDYYNRLLTKLNKYGVKVYA